MEKVVDKQRGRRRSGPGFRWRIGNVSRATRIAVALAAICGAFLAIQGRALAFEFGIQMDGYQTAIEDVTEVGHSGAHLYRIQMSPKTGAQFWEDLFLRAAENDVTIMPYVLTNLEGQTALPTAAEQPVYKVWLEEMVSKYGLNGSFWSSNPQVTAHPVKAWEVWNEPGNAGFGTFTPAEFANYVSFASTAIQHAAEIQSGQPTQVVFGGILSMDGSKGGYENYLAKTLEVAPAAITGVGFHPYVLHGSNEVAEMVSNVQTFHNWLVSHGHGSLPIWITEMGWPVKVSETSTEPGVSETEQASMLKSALTELSSHASSFNLAVALWYNIREGAPTPEWSNHCGLIREDGSFRPSWFAFQEVTGAAKWPPDYQAATTSAALYRTANGDLHSFYRSTDGHIWDLWLSASNNEWHEQLIGGSPSGEPSAVDRTANGDLHVLYRSTDGHIWDLWLSASNNEWHEQMVGGEAAGDPSALYRTANGDLHVFYRGTDGHLWDLWLSGTTWHEQLIGGSPAGDPSALYRAANGDLHVFYRSTDGHIWDAWMSASNNEWHIQMIGGSPSGDPSALYRTANGDLHVFYRGTDGHLWDLWLSASNGEWHETPLGGSLSGDPSAVYRADNGDLHVFYRGTDGHLWDIWLSASTNAWHEQQLGGTLSSAPFSVFRAADGDLHVFYRSTDGHLWDLWLSGTSWHEQLIGGLPSPEAGPASTSPALFRPDTGDLHAFYRATDGHIWDLWLSGSVWREQLIGGFPVGKPSALYRTANGDLHAFYRATDGHIWDLWLSGSVWHEQLIGGEAAGDPAALYRSANGDMHVFYRGADGHLWDLWLSASNSEWHEQLIGGSPAGDPSALYRAGNGDLHVFYRGTDGHIWDAWMSASNNEWHVQLIGGNTAGEPSALYRTANGDLHVFYRGTDGHLWDLWLSGTTWHEQLIGGSPAGDPSALYRAANGDLHVFYRSTDGHIWDAWMSVSNNEWHVQLIGGTATSSPFSVNRTDNGDMHVFYRSTDGHLWDLWLSASNNVWHEQLVGGEVAPETGVPAELESLPLINAFDGTGSGFAEQWAKLGLAAEKGVNTSNGWAPSAAYSTLAGSYYSAKTFKDTGTGIAAEATMKTNPGSANRYFALHLDMSEPAATIHNGYELRLTDTATNTYTMTLSKWQAGTQTVLSAKAGLTFTNGQSFAIVDRSGTVSAWADTGSGFVEELNAADSEFSGGSVGLSGSGNITRLAKMKAGSL